MDLPAFDGRPIIVAIAGPNGAGKTTFFHAHLASAGLPFVNADKLAEELAIGPYEAAQLADSVRCTMVSRSERFVFETVFSDPVGDKIAFLDGAARDGYVVVLCYIGLSDFNQSIERVAMRVSQGGHDVPDVKLRLRFSRSIENLRLAISRLPNVIVYDNSDLSAPYRRIAVFENENWRELMGPVPEWLQSVIR